MSNKRINHGSIFESNIEDSCLEQGVFFHNNRDIFLPPDVRRRVRLPKQKYDSLMFYKRYLFAMELKTTDKKSISMNDSIIKDHQIESLLDASKYPNVLAGLLLNFRGEENNPTYFIDIDDFLTYKEYAKNQLEHPYRCREGRRLNRASISLDICEEIGFDLRNELKQVHHRYFISDMLENILLNKGKSIM